MRVLMLSWDHSPRATSGTAAHVDGLSRALAADGHDVVILTVDEPEPPRVDEMGYGSAPPATQPVDDDDGGSITVLRTNVDLPWIPVDQPLARIASANHALTNRGVRLANGRDDVAQPMLGAWRPDVVHGHNWQIGWAADSLAAAFDVPLVMTLHGTERMRHSGQLPSGPPTDINAIEWWLALRADRLIGSTRLMVEQLVTGFELDAQHVVRIPNGIDPTEWRERRPARAPGEQSMHIVAWGNIQYEKGFQVLARAVHLVRSTMPDVRCTIVGRGRYLAELQTQIDVEGVSDVIDLPGFLDFGDLRRVIHSAGCVAVPSLYEPFGIVALEALAAGAPLIVAHTGGLAELVAGTGAGVTFEPGSPDALAAAIKRVLDDPTYSEHLTSQAHDLVEQHYTWAAIATRTLGVYRSASDEHRRD